MKKVLLILIVVVAIGITGCTSAPMINPSERTQMRTRTMDTDYDTAYRATLTTLENAGYTIDNTDMQSGLIKATTVTDAATPVERLFGTSGIDTSSVSCTISKASKDSTRVRINIREMSETSIEGQPGVNKSAAEVDDPAVYQKLFNELRVEIERLKAIS